MLITSKFTGAQFDHHTDEQLRRPMAPDDNCPRDKASDFVLLGGLSAGDAETLRCLTEGAD
jgi:hypothetical protein